MGCVCLLQSDNVFIDGLGWIKVGDFGEVKGTSCWREVLTSLTHQKHCCCCCRQARSDFGKHRRFFRKSGKFVMFTDKAQVGFGAAQATSPEVQAAVRNGPDLDADDDVPLWLLMRACDTWAVGRMMMELLLQCIHLEAKASATSLGMPPLTTAKYKQEDLPPLPGYSPELHALLSGMMAYDPAQRLKPQ